MKTGKRAFSDMVILNFIRTAKPGEKMLVASLGRNVTISIDEEPECVQSYSINVDELTDFVLWPHLEAFMDRQRQHEKNLLDIKASMPERIAAMRSQCQAKPDDNSDA